MKKNEKDINPHRWRREKRTLVYFVQAGHRSRVKVGKSTDVPERLKAIQAHCPDQLHLICTVPYTTVKEEEFHQYLWAKQKHLHHEWFFLNKKEALSVAKILQVIKKYDRKKFEKLMLRGKAAKGQGKHKHSSAKRLDIY